MNEINWTRLFKELVDTLYILGISGILIIVIGLVLGYVLFATSKSQKRIPILCNQVLSLIVNIARSIPFIILMILIIPFTILITGNMIGRSAAIPSLVISAAPFFARLVFTSLQEIPKGVDEALKSMGASKKMIILVFLRESLPGIIKGLTLTLVTLIGFIASAGAIGAGGLGEYAKQSAFQGDYKSMLFSVAFILIVVFVIQISGDLIAKKIDHR